MALALAAGATAVPKPQNPPSVERLPSPRSLHFVTEVEIISTAGGKEYAAVTEADIDASQRQFQNNMREVAMEKMRARKARIRARKATTFETEVKATEHTSTTDMSTNTAGTELKENSDSRTDDTLWLTLVADGDAEYDQDSDIHTSTPVSAGTPTFDVEERALTPRKNISKGSKKKNRRTKTQAEIRREKVEKRQAKSIALARAQLESQAQALQRATRTGGTFETEAEGWKENNEAASAGNKIVRKLKKYLPSRKAKRAIGREWGVEPNFFQSAEPELGFAR